MATTFPNHRSTCGSRRSFLRKTRLVLFYCCAIFMALTSRAEAPSATQYKLQAVFLFNFAQFIEWPSAAFSTANEPFTIAVLGKDPFGSVLDEIVQGEEIKGRKLRVERYRSLKEVKNCQILYVSASEEAHFEQIIKALKGKPILTVGDGEGFATNGGMIRFLPAQPKIRLRINIDALTEAKLTASSKLLRLAEVVHTKSK